MFVVNLSNEGVGPAIIKSMRVTLPDSLGGKSYDSWTQAVDIVEQQGGDVQTYWNYNLEVTYTSIYREEFKAELQPPSSSRN